MSQWLAVHGYGAENIEPDVLNRPVRELTERTNWLHDQLTSVLGTGTFESVRILNAALDTTSALAPSAGDFVQLDPVTRKYAQALATTSPDDAFTASEQAYAVGILTRVNADGTGTIVLYGNVDLSTDGSGWSMPDMIAGSTETYRNGTYYLSNVEAGKMTANPTGISIYLGLFQESATNPGYGGSAILNPQYRDTGEAHVHRAYPLYAQPVGKHSISDSPPLPTSTHSVVGFEANTAPTGSELVPRLVTAGSWLGSGSVTYTIWLSNSALNTTTPIGSTAPSSDWSTVYLHWVSSDSVEGSGVTRLWSFETLHAVGANGLIVSLEKMDGQANNNPYDPDGGDTEALRTWTIDVPDMTRGWLPCRVREYLTSNQATDVNLSFLLYGEFSNPDARSYETVTVKCGDLHNMIYSDNPTAGTTLIVAGTTFEFYSGSYSGSNVGVAIDSTLVTGVHATYQALMEAILGANITGVDAALSIDNNTLVILTSLGVSLSGTIDNVTAPGAATYTGEGNIDATSVGVLIYNEAHETLIDAAQPYWAGFTYWDETTLTNGLKLMAVPYSSDGTAIVSPGPVVTGDYWEGTFVDEAPGAKFKYAMPMHPSLAQYYPPVPRGSAALVSNGVELSSYDMFAQNADYHTGTGTIYWYNDGYAAVPWPQDWVDKTDDGSDIYRKNIVYHLVHMAAGNTGRVTSLRSASGSPVRVIQCGTNDDGTTGDLELALDLNLQESDAGLSGYRVVKEVVGQKLIRGPVVEKIQSDGTISIAQNIGAPDGQGTVTLSVATSQFAGDLETVALQNAKQEVIGMFPYIRLLGWQTGGTSNTATAFIGKFRVPHTIAYNRRYRVVFYATVFGEQDIPWVGGGSPQYAGLTFEYSVLPDHVAIITPTGSDDVWNSLDDTLPNGLMTMTEPITAEIPFGVYNAGVPSVPIYKGYDPMLIHNDNTLSDIPRRQARILGVPFPVAEQLGGWVDATGPYVRAGSLVGIRIARGNILSAGQEYTGPIGFINMRWKLVSAGEDA